MKIQKLTISDEELKEAVQAFLKTKGLDLPIHSVTKPYSWQTESEVTFEFEVEAKPPPSPELDTEAAKALNTLNP